MNKKIIYGILALIVLVGVVLVVTIGLKLDMKNDANTKIYVYIGKEFDNNDIEQIAKETFETDTAIVQKVEIYNEMALITIKEQNTENINEKIESLNSKINEKYGLENYLDINNFDLKNDNSNLEYIEKLIEEIKKEIVKGNGKHDAITHYMNKYGFVPPWVATKILSLGTISKFYGLMKQQDRQEISKQFHINDKILKNILGNLTSVRNIAAHDDRLYTYRSTFYIRLDKTKKCPDKPLYTNMYIIIK